MISFQAQRSVPQTKSHHIKEYSQQTQKLPALFIRQKQRMMARSIHNPSPVQTIPLAKLLAQNLSLTKEMKQTYLKLSKLTQKKFTLASYPTFELQSSHTRSILKRNSTLIRSEEAHMKTEPEQQQSSPRRVLVLSYRDESQTRKIKNSCPVIRKSYHEPKVIPQMQYEFGQPYSRQSTYEDVSIVDYVYNR